MPSLLRFGFPTLRGLCIWLLSWLWLLLPGELAAQTPAKSKLPLLQLQPALLPVVPQEFYVARVLDARADRTAVAALLLPPAGGKPGLLVKQPVDFQNGMLPAFRDFVQQRIPHNVALRPITIELTECRVTETAAPGGAVEGRVTVAMRFSWTREGQLLHLTDYRGAARYGRPAARPDAVAPVLQQALTEALLYFNAWINRQVTTNEKLATGLAVSFADYAGPAEADTVFYSLTRPLIWADFTAAPRTGDYAAAVFPSFSYAGRPEIVAGRLHLYLTFKVFVVRSSSWVGPGQRTPYNLNHEQRHFDLVQLVVERYKRRVPADSLTLTDYNSQLQYQYIESYREMNRVQEQYDAETQHGRDAAAQQRWNQRIDAELRRYGVK